VGSHLNWIKTQDGSIDASFLEDFMVKKNNLSKFLQYILGDNIHIPLEQRCVTGICFFLSIAFFITVPLNYFLNLPKIIIISCFFFGILFGLYYYFSRFKNKYKNIFWLLIVSTCLFITLSWFYNGGIDGSSTIISLIAIALINLIATGRQRHLSIFLIIFILGVLFFIEYIFPDSIVAYHSREDRFFDTYFTFMIAAFITSFVISYVLQNFREEREKATTAKKKLKDSEYLFRILAETTSTGIMLYQEHHYVYANPAALKLCGYSLDELKTMNFWELVTPEHTERIKKIGLKRETGESAVSGYETRLLTKAAQEKRVYIEGSTIEYYGKPAGLISMIDITKLKQAQKDLAHLRNYLSNIIDSMPSILVGVDSALHITQWNKQAEKQTCLPAVTVIGSSLFKVIPRLAPEEKKIKTAILEHTIQKNIRLLRQEDGQPHYEDVTVYPLLGKGVEGAVIRLDEVTEKVRLEEMVIQSEKMMSIGGLAAGMAHEINNPLAGILQSAQVICNRITKNLPANEKAAMDAGTSMVAIKEFMEKRKILQQLNNISIAGNRAAGIVENMLSFARKGKLEKTPQSIPALLEQTIELASSDYDLKKQYDFKKILLVTEFAPDFRDVMCEPGKIIQVLFNLIKNAAQAMHGMDKKSVPPQFTFRLIDFNTMAQIEIEDNGPGMDEETRKRIFEPFFTTKDVDKGTGLGLSLSYFIIVEDHKGEMEVVSTLGEGTKFIIRLPFYNFPLPCKIIV